MTWTAIATVASAIFAAVSAVGALLAARATKRAAEAQILLNMLNDYKAPEMDEALRTLTAWHALDQSAAQWKSSFMAGDAGAQDVNHARRHVTSYFQNADQLRQCGLISKKTFRAAICKSGLAVLTVVAEELEKQLNPKVDLTFIQRLTKVCPNQKTLFIYRENR